MALKSYQKLAYRLFKNPAKKSAEAKPELDIILEKAHMSMRSDVFIATTWLNAVVGAISGVVIAVILIAVIIPAMSSSQTINLSSSFKMLLTLLAAVLPVLLAVVGYFASSSKPQTRLRERATNIDKNLPYAVNYMAAMASADVAAAVIFKGLARQKI